MTEQSDVELETVVTCPKCNATTVVTMPEDSCVYFWKCPECNSLVKPLKGDCCVFCSYGTVSCPPVQKDRSCC